MGKKNWASLLSMLRLYLCQSKRKNNASAPGLETPDLGQRLGQITLPDVTRKKTTTIIIRTDYDDDY